MNGKRLLILAAFAAFASFAMPAAFASTVSNQTNITIKWNTQAVGSLVIHTNYNASGAFGGAAAAVLTGTNGGTTGTCTAAPAGQTDLTVDFTNVTADGVKFTNCQYKNGFNAAIITSDPNGYQLGYAATAALPAGYGLCAIHNGTWINNMAVTQSAAATATVQTSATCTSGDRMDSTGTSNAFTPSPVNSTTGTNLGGDIELVIPANAAVGAATVTEQFTLTLL